MRVLCYPKLTSVLYEGNNPPWFNKAKAKYGLYEGRRASVRAGKPEMNFPEDLMPMSHTVLVSTQPKAPGHKGHTVSSNQAYSH